MEGLGQGALGCDDILNLNFTLSIISFNRLRNKLGTVIHWLFRVKSLILEQPPKNGGISILFADPQW